MDSLEGGSANDPQRKRIVSKKARRAGEGLSKGSKAGGRVVAVVFASEVDGGCGCGGLGGLGLEARAGEKRSWNCERGLPVLVEGIYLSV